MNCSRCHHTDQAHESLEKSKSLLKRGKCNIPQCTCKEFRDSIKEIDEELI